MNLRTLFRRQRRRAPRFFLTAEILEYRATPSVGFNSVTGLLSVTGDESGISDDTLAANVAGVFVEATVNGQTHSSDPISANFDPAIEGATPMTVLSVLEQGLDGNDTLALGNGFIAASGQITLDGGAGNDWLDFGSSLIGVKIGLTKNTAKSDTKMILAAIENVIGSPFADKLTGNIATNILLGGAGNDKLSGGAGNDSLDGGAGDDKLNGGDGDDSLNGGDGADKINGGSGNDSLLANAGNDLFKAVELGLPPVPPIIFASNGALTVAGDPNAPTNDVISATIVTVPCQTVGQCPTVGSILITINGVSHSSDPTYAAFDPALTGATKTTVKSILIQGNDGNDSITLGNGFDAANGHITLRGGAGDDSIQGGATNETLLGNSGDDSLVGNDGNDSLKGGGGNDTVLGGLGDDIIETGCSNFGLPPSDGDDSLNGGAGNDTLVGSLGFLDILVNVEFAYSC